MKIHISIVASFWIASVTFAGGPTSRGTAPAGMPQVRDVASPTRPGVPAFTPQFAQTNNAPAGQDARAYAYQYTIAPSFFYGGWGGSRYGFGGYGAGPRWTGNSGSYYYR